MARSRLSYVRERLLGSSEIAVWSTVNIKGQAELEIGVLFGFQGELRYSRLEIDHGVGAKRDGPDEISDRHLRSIVRRADLKFVTPANAAQSVDVPEFVEESVTSRVAAAPAAGD